ncbi:hypothetical protein FM125_02845 [Micrococcus lylae]|uniref:Uncharacterized protein n=1 Tax=Micrococcus lylae TaxID=1273 RepID=A0A1R4IJ71_9MICC|nr:hypothetical protein FM125_02845 [Micrococcus lylae]
MLHTPSSSTRHCRTVVAGAGWQRCSGFLAPGGPECQHP